MRTITIEQGGDREEEVTIPGPFPTVEHMKRHNQAQGYYFFSTDTMRSFSSRIAPGVTAGRFFITSERSGFDLDSPRRYTIRCMRDDGTVAELFHDGFLKHDNLRAARKALKDAVNRATAEV